MKKTLTFLLTITFWSCADSNSSSEKSNSNASMSQPVAANVFVNVSADSAFAFIQRNTNDTSFVILDARTPKEFKRGHIANAELLDFTSKDFSRKLEMLDKKKTYLLHCASGGRSGKTMKMMRKMGFEKVYHMNGGMREWVEKKLPVEK